MASTRLSGATMAYGMDAFHPYHLPLPRPVGGYATIKTTQIVKPTRSDGGTTSSNILIGAFGAHDNDGHAEWCNICCISESNQPSPGPATLNGTRFYPITPMADGSWDACRFVPAAVSVQIMNPEALQTTSGMVYIGRCKQVLDLSDDTRTYEEILDSLVSYSSPRLCAAGKLALRGVQVDAIPYNMNSLSDFRKGFRNSGPFAGTLDNNACQFDGFAPIFIRNPENVPLQLLICIEWRARFDPGNPAYASHHAHRCASDSDWQSVISHQESQGHGAIDIADKMRHFFDSMRSAGRTVQSAATAGMAIRDAAAAARPLLALGA